MAVRTACFGQHVASAPINCPGGRGHRLHTFPRPPAVSKHLLRLQKSTTIRTLMGWRKCFQFSENRPTAAHVTSPHVRRDTRK